MSFSIRLTLTAAAVSLLASCGGGSADSPPLPTSGRVVDGYLSGATVLCDSNGNGIADDGELKVTTDSGGNFTFASPGCAAGLTAFGGTDIDTKLAFKGVFKAPAGATVITPLTTLLASGMSQERVIAALGLAANTDIAHANPALDTALMKKSLAAQQLLIKTAEMFAGLGGVSTDAALQALHAEVSAAFAIVLQGGGTLISGNDMNPILVAQLVKAATTRVAASAAVPAQIKTALASVNAESLGIVVSGGLTAQAEHIVEAAESALTAAATASQGDTTATVFVKANAGLLAAAPTAATQAQAAVLTAKVAGGLGSVPVVPEVPALPAAPATLPISFDGSTPVIFLGFNGAEGSTVQAGPAGAAGKSLKILRSGGEVYAGAFITTVAMPFAADRKTFTARVYSPKAGVPMVLKVEGANGLSSADVQATSAVVVGWQTLTWVATGLDLSKSYNKLTLLPNLGAVDAAPGQSYYFDDIALVADSVTPPAAPAAALPISFDETAPPTLGQFGAGAAVAIAAGPSGGSGNAAKFTKTAGDTWAGFFFSTATIPFSSTSKTVTARVHSSKAGAPMVMKVEGPGGVSSAEIAATPATVVGWQTLTWTFTGLDLSKTYQSIAVIPDSGNSGTGQSYYVDDVTLVADSTAVPPAAGYLALVADSISVVNGPAKTVYTMGQFESDAGISLAWPIPSPMVMKVALTDVGNLSLPADLKVSAAVSITETVMGGKGEIQAYIANVSVKKTASGLEIAVPTTSADALAYTVSTDAKKKLVIDFGSGVKGVGNTLTTVANMTNSLVFGEVVQYAINNISGQGFTGIYALRGKYRMTVVLTGLPLRRADGTVLPTLSVVVPTLLNESGGVAASKTISGPGLVGHVTLTN
jgi:hypothetical protein